MQNSGWGLPRSVERGPHKSRSAFMDPNDRAITALQCMYIHIHAHTYTHRHMHKSEHCPILAKIYLYELDSYIRHVYISIPILNILC